MPKYRVRGEGRFSFDVDVNAEDGEDAERAAEAVIQAVCNGDVLDADVTVHEVEYKGS